MGTKQKPDRGRTMRVMLRVLSAASYFRKPFSTMDCATKAGVEYHIAYTWLNQFAREGIVESWLEGHDFRWRGCKRLVNVRRKK